MKNDSPSVAIAIITHNGLVFLEDLFKSLASVEYPGRYEIIVVDNASTDGTIDYLKRINHKITFIASGENLGFVGGNDLAYQYAKRNGFHYLYLLNQDTVVSPDFLKKTVVLAENDMSIGAVQSLLKLYEDQELVNSRGNEIHFLGFAFAGGHKTKAVPGDNIEIAYPSGAATLYRMSSLAKVGFFTKNFFMYHEDTDLGWRLWLGGYRCMLEPLSVVYHKYEFSRSIKKYYYMERNRLIVLLQNYKLATLLIISPALLLMNILMILYSFIGGWWKEELKAYAYFLSLKNWRSIRNARNTVRLARKVKDREVTRHFTGKIEFQDLRNPVLIYVVNPVFNLYWSAVKKIIWW